MKNPFTATLLARDNALVISAARVLKEKFPDWKGADSAVAVALEEKMLRHMEELARLPDPPPAEEIRRELLVVSVDALCAACGAAGPDSTAQDVTRGLDGPAGLWVNPRALRMARALRLDQDASFIALGLESMLRFYGGDPTTRAAVKHAKVIEGASKPDPVLQATLDAIGAEEARLGRHLEGEERDPIFERIYKANGKTSPSFDARRQAVSRWRREKKV